jgi:hypothetical protein
VVDVGGESGNVYIPPSYATAASFVPSELDAIEYQTKDADADV